MEKKEAIQLIGQKALIVKAANKGLEGIQGVIVDETRNTIGIETDGKVRKVLKKEVRLQISSQEIEGKDLIGTMSERLKKKNKW